MESKSPLSLSSSPNEWNAASEKEVRAVLRGAVDTLPKESLLALVPTFQALSSAITSSNPKDTKPPKDNSAWWSAALNKESAQVAVEALKNGQNVDERNPEKNNATALHLAIYTFALDLVPVLLDHGANVILFDDSKMNALDFAVAAGNSKVIKALIAKGATPESSPSGFQPLCRAALVPNGATVAALLLFCGAKVMPESPAAPSPLDYALRASQLISAAYLILNGCKTTKNAPPQFAEADIDDEMVQMAFDQALKLVKSAIDFEVASKGSGKVSWETLSKIVGSELSFEAALGFEEFDVGKKGYLNKEEYVLCRLSLLSREEDDDE